MSSLLARDSVGNWTMVGRSSVGSPTAGAIGATFANASAMSSGPLTLDLGRVTFPNTSGVTLSYVATFTGASQKSRGSPTGSDSMPSTFTLFNFGGYSVYVLGGRVYAEDAFGSKFSSLPAGTTQVNERTSMLTPHKNY